MPEITVVTRDAARITFPCPASAYVLDAAEAAGFYLPSMCRSGDCGLCQGIVTDGKYAMGRYNSSILATAPAGSVPLCRCRPCEKLTIALPCYESQIGRRPATERRAVIEAVAPAGEGAIALTLRLRQDAEHDEVAEFIPGQYMQITIPGTQSQRAYSMANLPNLEGRLEFLVRLVPGGAFCSWLTGQAEPGQELQLHGPFGQFVLDETSPRPRCFAGGGCGAAPVLSMLRQLAETHDRHPVHLIFGANRQQELFLAKDIAALRASLPQLTVTLAVWHPEPGWSGFSGTSADALAEYLATGVNPDIYICGPPKMLEAALDVAQARGVAASHIFVERI